MGTTAQKLEYLGTTKSQLKDMINYGLDDNNKITNSTTFRNYVSSIFNAFLEALRTPDTLFTNLPKKSSSGSVISLNDTANAPMRIELGASELSQETTLGTNLIGLTTAQCPVDFAVGDYIIMKNTTNTALRLDTFANYGDETRNDYWSVGSNATRTVRLEKVAKAFAWGADVGSDGLAWLNAGQTILDYEPYTGGIPAPNPSYPEDIHTISGSNTIVVRQNLFDKNNANIITATFNENEILTSTNGRVLYIPITGGHTYIVNKRLSARFRVATTQTLPSVGVSVIGQIDNASSTSITINSTSNSNYLVVYYFLNGTDTLTEQQILDSISIFDNDVKQTQAINLGEIEYCKIGSYEDKFIRNSGKNLLDIKGTSTNADITMTAQANGIYISGTSTSSRTFSFLGTNGVNSPGQYFQGITLSETNAIKLSAGTYTLSYIQNKNAGAVITYYGNYGARLDASTNVPNNSTFTITEDKYLFMGMYTSNGTETNYLLENIQLEKNNQATSYEPYGNGTWYIKKNIGKVVLDGSEYWQNYTTVSGNIVQVALAFTSGARDGMSNLFPVTTDYSATEHIVIGGGLTTLYVHIDKTRLGSEDVAGFKSWLSSNNTTLDYILATPTYTQITGTLAEQLENVYKNMLSQAGQTTISQINADLPFNMSIQAIEDISNE